MNVMNAPRFHAVRRIVMAAGICALAASPFALPPVAGAQTTGVAAVPLLIVFGQERSLDAGGSVPGLTPEQQAVLDAITDDGRVLDVRLAQTPEDALSAVTEARAMALDVPGGRVSFTGVGVRHNAEAMVSLSAGDPAQEGGPSASLVVQGADVLGAITHRGETWRVSPLGGGVSVMYRYLLNGLRMDPPGWDGSAKPMRRQPVQQGRKAAPRQADTGDTIDVMVVYTPGAAVGGIDLFIQSMVDNTNEAYRRSNVPFRLRLVHKQQVQYRQDPRDMGADLRALDDVDGVMDEVQGWRDEHGADLVALLVARSDSTNTCGVAWTPPYGAAPSRDFEDWGWSVIGRSCEGPDYLVFAHELGHNQGALHDPYNSERTCPAGPASCTDRVTGNFAYRYGRCNTAGGWRSIMAYQERQIGGSGYCRQYTGLFSSPLVRFRGTPTGDALRRDNRRVLVETARRVANFRRSRNEPPPPPPPPEGDLHATLPYVAPAGQGHPSLVRVLNDSAEPNTVQVTGYDDSGQRFGPESLSIAAREAVTLTSNVLESGGDTGGGTFAGLGDGQGWWRLELEGERAFRAGTYYRTADGFLAELSAPVAGELDGSGRWRYDVGFFNPGINTARVSILRLANPDDQAAEVVVAGRDDRGREAPGGPVTVSLPAQGAATFTVQALENGGDGLTGRLGDGEGKWRLTVTADRPVQVMSLLRATQTGHLANLSAIVQGAQGSAPPPPPPPETAPDLVVRSPSVSDSSLNAGARFTLSVRVRNQGDGPSAATTLRYYRSSNARISILDTTVGTDAVGSLSASEASGESISLTAPSSAGTYYYGACVDSVAGESSTGNNCSAAVRVTVSVSGDRRASYCNAGNNLWGAIAGGWEGQHCEDGFGWGAAWNRRDQASAISRAESLCRSAGLRDCAWDVAFSSCGALAYGESSNRCNLFGGFGATRSAAEQRALSRCRAAGYDCRIPVGASGSAQAGPHAEAQSGGYMAEPPPGTSNSGSRLIPDRSPRPVVEER